MKTLEIIVFLALIFALGFGIYVFWQNLPIGSVQYTPYSANLSSQEITGAGLNLPEQSRQFYQNMRYRDRNISYELESVCGLTKWVNVKKAFEMISERTNLNFYISKENPEIMIYCSELPSEPGQENHFIAGEGGPTEIINTSLYAVILSGKISIYKEERCSEPKITLHEIFHALGFDHNNNSNSILYPITGCNEQIDGYLIDGLNRLYKTDSNPDIVIEKVTANRTGRYLNFEINITNRGLKDSQNATLHVYSDSLELGNFTLGGLEIGVKKTLDVQNLRISGFSNKITFIVKPAEGEGEISTGNDRAELAIA